VLAEVRSPPLDSVVAMTNRRSLNIGAELLLHWAGGWEAPAESLEAYIADVIGTTDGFRLVDGSGFSHEDRVTARVMASYLARIPARAGLAEFPFLLPANGAGTLAKLRGGFRGGAGVVRAKTGTLAGVATLAGYLGRREGTYIVAAFFNGGRTRRARAAQWQLFRVIGGDGIQIPVDTDFGPEVVSDTLETPAPAPAVPATTDSTDSSGSSGAGSTPSGIEPVPVPEGPRE
jgi:D-alanyl-D-alanine carboxypeptidase